MVIPILNLYHLLIYAWDALDEAEFVDVSSEPESHIADLLAAVLNEGIHHVVRRGMDRGYQPDRQEIAGIRGKLDVSGTIKSCSLMRGRAICEFDEFTCNILHNRILRSTVRQLLSSSELPVALHASLLATDRHLRGIDSLQLSRSAFRAVHLHRNNRFYRFLMHVCRLLYDMQLLNEQTGAVQFRDFERDERRMRSLFERFLRNFYYRKQNVFHVARHKFRWKHASSSSPHGLGLLPHMATDITLTSENRKIVIDAKYYREAMQSNFGKKSVRSGHLYQMFSYLRNIHPGHGKVPVEAILIYPAVDQPIDLHYIIHGHPLRIVTVDLTQSWQCIEQFLLDLLESSPGSQKD